MSNFHIFASAVNARFQSMSTGELYTVDAGDLFETYLAAFPAGTNPLYRVRTEFDCSCCKNFVRNIGHVVSIRDGVVSTVWSGLDDLPYPFYAVAATLDNVVRQLPINGIYRTEQRRYGAQRTTSFEPGTAVHEWNHFWCDIPERNRPAHPDKERGDANTAAQMFRRALDELSVSACLTVVELIAEGSLYRGAEKLPLVRAFLDIKQEFDAAADKNLFVWSKVAAPVARFRNDVIGTLVSDLSEGIDLDKAVRMYESKVAPENYRRTTSVITSRMVDAAVTQLRELGLESTVERRMARLSDVSVSNVLFVDNAVRGNTRDGLAGLLMDSVKPHTPDLKHATPIGIDEFVRDVVPTASSIDVLVQNKHVGNFVTLTAPVHADDAAVRLFRWNNGFAWSYEGDVADSVKQRVKRAGGNVDNAALRVSLAWSNKDDLDLHCRQPDGSHVFYGNKLDVLDVDMNNGWGSLRRDPVENLSWTRMFRLRDGVYKVWVHQFNRRETIDVGFSIEIECAGDLHQFTYDKAVNGNVDCFDIHVRDGQIAGMVVHPELKGGNASQEVWSVQTETLVPVATLMNSPNHWDGNAVGNKHWFFILKGCKNPSAARGIYNEFLGPALNEHRKVFEVLGSKTKCPPTDDQLSGVGFSSSRGDTVTAVVKGRAFNIQF